MQIFCSTLQKLESLFLAGLGLTLILENILLGTLCWHHIDFTLTEKTKSNIKSVFTSVFNILCIAYSSWSYELLSYWHNFLLNFWRASFIQKF